MSDGILVKKGEKIPSLINGERYGIKLERYRCSLSDKLINGEMVEARAIELGYYNGVAKENIEIFGPFKYLNLIRKSN